MGAAAPHRLRGGKTEYLDYIKNYIKGRHSAGRRDGLITRLWAIARMRLGAGGAAEYLELVGL